MEFLKGLVVELDAPIVKLVERHMCSFEGYRRGVWKKLVCFEDHKRFFGTEVVDVLEGFQGKRLRSVDMCGTVDERLMRVVADAIGITVRAKVGEDDRNRWLQPPSATVWLAKPAYPATQSLQGTYSYISTIRYTN